MIPGNSIIIVGRVLSNPIIKVTKKGVEVTTFLVGTYREDAETLHRVVMWGKRTFTPAMSEAIYVEGSLVNREVTGKDGIARQSFEIHAKDVFLCGGAA